MQERWMMTFSRRGLLLTALASDLICAAQMTIALGATLADGATSQASPSQLRIYVVDVGHGNTVFVVAPSGEVLLLDAGPARASQRILAFMEQNGIRKVDYALVSHFDDDHFGAVAAIAEKYPVACFLDHGQSVSYGKDEAWWQSQRGQSYRVGMGKEYDRSLDEYLAARAKARHVVLKPGDSVPVKGLEVKVVCAGGKVISEPLPGAGGGNPACDKPEKRGPDTGEDGQSIGVLVSHGKFRFIDLGDLTWNLENALFCPRNLVGTVDVYLITHHARTMPPDMGEYNRALSSCPPGEVLGLRPRVAILSLGAAGHRGGSADAMQLVHRVPGLDLWQTELIREGGEKDHNAPEQFIANVGNKSVKVPYIAVVAREDGSLVVTNSRTEYAKAYGPPAD